MTISSGEKNDVSGVSTNQPERSRIDSVDRHLQEMLRNRDSWEKKPVLQAVYRSFYKEIAAGMVDPAKGPVVELGSGIGVSKNFIPNCVTTDIFPNPWLDRLENAYELNFNDSSIRNLILFDVFHHLKYPGSALVEFWRVVMPGGRVILFEPAMGLLGKLVYGLFHHEPLGFNSRIELFPLPGEQPSEHGYYAAQGNAWRIFINGENSKLLDGWNLLLCKPLCALSYVLSGGFSKPSLYPFSFLPAMRTVDRFLQVSPAIFATRLLVVLEKMG
jgi:SAM-dependent methyltransferase